MDRLFLDANILFSAAYSPNAGLTALWKLKKVALCSSRYALEEARINLSDESQLDRLAKLSVALELFGEVEAELPNGISLPEKDVPIFLAAIKGRSTHLLTGDIRHFGRYLGRRISGILIQLPGNYLRSRARG